MTSTGSTSTRGRSGLKYQGFSTRRLTRRSST